MCQFLSVLVTRTDIIWDRDSDSHEALIQQVGLSDGLRGLDAVRATITPPKGWDGKKLEGWSYRTDQCEMPDWYSAAEAEQTVRDRLPGILAAMTAVDGQEITGGRWIIPARVSVTLHSGHCYSYAGSYIVLYDGMCYARNGSHVEMHFGACDADAGSTVTLHDGYCHARNGSHVEKYGGLCDDDYGSTVIDC
jgi:hypothetical protein